LGPKMYNKLKVGSEERLFRRSVGLPGVGWGRGLSHVVG